MRRPTASRILGLAGITSNDSRELLCPSSNCLSVVGIVSVPNLVTVAVGRKLLGEGDKKAIFRSHYRKLSNYESRRLIKLRPESSHGVIRRISARPRSRTMRSVSMPLLVFRPESADGLAQEEANVGLAWPNLSFLSNSLSEVVPGTAC